MDAKLRREKHRATEARGKLLRKGLLEACKQLGFWEDLRERDEPHRCSVGERKEEGAEACRKTELQAAHDLQRVPRRNPNGCDQSEAQQTELRRSFDPRSFEDPHVRLFYDFVQPTWGDRAEVLFTDTDSLALQVRTEDLYKDIEPHIESWFDTSKLKPGNRQGLTPGVNSGVVGKFKDEEPNDVITDFVGVRAKNYGYKTLGGAEKKKDKGIKKSVIKKEITFEDFKDCVLNGVVKHVAQNTIRSRNHEVFTESLYKKALCPKDDKRIVLEDGIHTLPIRHSKHLKNLGFEERKALESVIEWKRKDLRDREALREREAQRKIEAEGSEGSESGGEGSESGGEGSEGSSEGSKGSG